MKKLLILSTLISSMVFANGEIQGNVEKEGVMNIKATVIRPLNVKVVKNVNLGTIVMGSTATGDGEFKVTGEPGALYTATLSGMEKNNTIILANGNDKLVAKIVHKSLETKILGPDGNDHIILVQTKVPVDQAPGEYTGHLTMSVRYDG